MVAASLMEATICGCGEDYAEGLKDFSHELLCLSP
jgi:hypothetical protein